ncbi:MAG: dephospho-CoA kinase [Sphingobacteriales bacterium]|nr:dephospho-CoA kinase [Sphingobacteriales bacterium]
MLKIGLTGGIGSGKSTVAVIFELLGIPVYYADLRAKELMNSNDTLKASIQKAFGPSSYTAGKLNRSFLAESVFGHPEKLALLNSLVHPVTIADAQEWMKNQTSTYTLKEAALIFESGSANGLDAVIGVSAPKEIRISRVMQRDHSSYEEVVKRMDGQMDEATKISLCQYVIYNDEQSLLIPQVIGIHEMLKVKASEIQVA